jgi:predicted nucleic acid-binding protein
MRAVLDTNVIVSATLIRGGNEDRVLRAWLRGTFELVLSARSSRRLDEYLRTTSSGDPGG